MKIYNSRQLLWLSGFLLGYKEMLRRIEPEYIICFGKPFDEMEGNLIVIDYNDSRKVVR